MKAFNQVWALTILMVPPCNTRTSYQTWTSDTRTNTKLQWWKRTRPKLPRSSRRSSKSEMVKTMTLLWFITGRRRWTSLKLMFSTKLRKMKHQSTPLLSKECKRNRDLLSTNQLRTWILQRCKWLVNTSKLRVCTWTRRQPIKKWATRLCRDS